MPEARSILEPGGPLEQYKSLLSCTKSLETACRTLGVRVYEEIPEAFNKQAQQVISALEVEMQVIVRSYIANLAEVKVNKKTGVYYKTSAYTLLKRIDKQGLVRYTMGPNRNEVGFKGVTVTFDLVSEGSSTEVEERLLEAVTQATLEYKHLVTIVYTQLKHEILRLNTQNALTRMGV